MKRNRLLHNQTDSDPMGTVANLFDVAMVFAVALMVALVTRFNMTEMFSKEDFTMKEESRKREYGNHYERRTGNQAIHSQRETGNFRQAREKSRCSLPTGKWRNYLCSGIMIDIRHPLNKS